MENLKKAVGDAGTFLSRAVQFTEEKLGKAERTENDPHFDMLARKADKIKGYTEKLVKDGEAVLVPNPAARLETFMFETIPVDKIGVTNKRLTNLEYMGQDMIEAGNEFGAGTPYGSALIRVGQTEQALGEIERDYIRAGHESMMGPLQRFLEGEMKNITRERKILENKRLDLDACKNRVRKARGMQLQPAAETELRIAQAEYDKQMEITKLLMEGLNAIQTNHLRHIKSFVEAQAKYYANCHQIMQDLQKELAKLCANNVLSYDPESFSCSSFLPPWVDQPRMRAQALADLDASNKDELSLMAYEVLNILELEPREEDWVLGERGVQQGRVPRYLLRFL